jgi:hypothetical protein
MNPPPLNEWFIYYRNRPASPTRPTRRSVETRITQEALRRHVLRVLRAWRERYMFSDDYLNGLQVDDKASPCPGCPRSVLSRDSLIPSFQRHLKSHLASQATFLHVSMLPSAPTSTASGSLEEAGSAVPPPATAPVGRPELRQQLEEMTLEARPRVPFVYLCVCVYVMARHDDGFPPSHDGPIGTL